MLKSGGALMTTYNSCASDSSCQRQRAGRFELPLWPTFSQLQNIVTIVIPCMCHNAAAVTDHRTSIHFVRKVRPAAALRRAYSRLRRAALPQNYTTLKALITSIAPIRLRLGRLVFDADHGNPRSNVPDTAPSLIIVCSLCCRRS